MVLFVSCVAAICATASANPAGDQALFIQRLNWAMKGGDSVLDVAALIPQEVIRGGNGRAIERVAPGQSLLTQEASNAAIALVKPLHTAQLLVWHKGALQLEYYSEGGFARRYGCLIATGEDWLRVGPYVQRRGAFNPQTVRGVRGTLHSEPYLADDVFMFDGNANQIVYIIPSQQLIIVRTGNAPPRGPNVPEWDNAFLPNTLIRGIIGAKGTSVAQK